MPSSTTLRSALRASRSSTSAASATGGARQLTSSALSRESASSSLRRSPAVFSAMSSLCSSLLQRAGGGSTYALSTTVPVPSLSSSSSPSSSSAATDTASSQKQQKVKTGIVMMNMGGPAHPSDTGDFLRRLFTDSDIINLGGGRMQQLIGTMVAKRRTPRIAQQYEDIGGSPILKWTEQQGREMAKLLDVIHPESAPHKAYVAFRYTNPLTDAALSAMAEDGVERAVAFSQFPQWSCTTSGSSLNELWRELRRLGLEKRFEWSILDRWATHPGYIESVVERIEERLPQFGAKPPLIMFSAHSLPLRVVEKGDPYTNEVAASVRAVVERLGAKRNVFPRHMLTWQSKVGPLPWMVPSTENSLKGLAAAGYKNVLVVPIAFTSDHVETLFEINMEYRHVATEAGIKQFDMTEGINGLPTFAKALADMCAEHLDREENYSAQYKLRCLGCQKPACRGILNAKY